MVYAPDTHELLPHFK